MSRRSKKSDTDEPRGFFFDGDELKHGSNTNMDPVTGELKTTGYDRVDVALMRANHVIEAHIKHLDDDERQRYIQDLFQLVLRWKRDKK